MSNNNHPITVACPHCAAELRKLLELKEASIRLYQCDADSRTDRSVARLAWEQLVEKFIDG